MVAGFDIEPEVGGSGEVCEGHQQSLEQESGSVWPEQQGDECEQQCEGGHAGAADNGLNVNHLFGANCLNFLGDLLLQVHLHQFRAGVRESLRGTMNGHEGGESFLKIRESQVDSRAELFRGKVADERFDEPFPCDPGGDDSDGSQQ